MTHPAVNLMNDGYTCSQSILMAYAPGFGMDADTASRLSTGFAGGLALGKTCGAVSAAVMVLGLSQGQGVNQDPFQKDLCFALTQEFCHCFREKQQTTRCSRILMRNGVDPTDPAQMKQLREKGFCTTIVADAARILDRLLADGENF